MGWYTYHDADCDGYLDTVDRWMLDFSVPDTNAVVDLDGDGSCALLAYFITDDIRYLPMGSFTGQVACDGAFQPMTVSMYEVPPMPLPTPALTPAPTPAPMSNPLLTVPWPCTSSPSWSTVTSASFQKTNTCATGAPIYHSSDVGPGWYLYHDAGCDGDPDTVDRWIFGFSVPDTNAVVDLDGDGSYTF